LKWYWWRFNGYGYFWGMITGITAALVLAFPGLLGNVPAVKSLLAVYPVNLDVTIVFPLVLAISLVGCLLGTLLTKAEDDAVLMDFYRRVRPWGFWGPVLKKVLAEDPGFKRNKDFGLYVVIQEYQRAALTLAVILCTSLILKFTWYDHLEEREVETNLAAAGDK
jgi:hypothetical protein